MSAGRGLSALALVVLGTFLSTAPAAAHSFRPTLLDVARQTESTWVVRWTVPGEAVSGDVQAWMPVMPTGCAPRSEHGIDTPTAHVRTWVLDCADLEGTGVIRLPAGARLGNVILTYDDGPRSLAGAALPPGTMDVPIGAVDEPPLSAGDTFRGYFVIGIEHILLGPDHLLFVLCLLLLVHDPRRLVGAVTGFTVGHSVTLVAATFDLAALPSGPVEALIALSIVLLAAEAVNATRPGSELPGWARRPLLIAATFGLIHGFGFAGALADLGLPDGQRGLALAAFNLGVEAGQLAFVAVAFPALAAARRTGSGPRVAATLAILSGAIAAYWSWDRVLGTLGLV